MRCIFALLLATAAFASVPTATAAECVQTACVAAEGYQEGSCADGSQGNYLTAWNLNGFGYVGAGAGSYCYGAPNDYATKGINGGVTVCDASWDCTNAGLAWGGGYVFGEYECDSYVFLHDNGAYTTYALPLCTALGPPPAVPALLP